MRISFIFFGGYSLFIYLTPFPELLLASLEDEYPPLRVESLDTSLHYNMIVLGAGQIWHPGASAVTQLNKTLAARLLEGIRIYRNLPHVTFMGSGEDFSKAYPMAKQAIRAAVELGVSPADTISLRGGYNTREEAASYYRHYGNSTPLILVTSAYHMPRAVCWFTAQGISVIPAPANYSVNRKRNGRPGVAIRWDWKRIERMALFLHEWGGWVQYYFSKEAEK